MHDDSEERILLCLSASNCSSSNTPSPCLCYKHKASKAVSNAGSNQGNCTPTQPATLPAHACVEHTVASLLMCDACTHATPETQPQKLMRLASLHQASCNSATPTHPHSRRCATKAWPAVPGCTHPSHPLLSPVTHATCAHVPLRSGERVSPESAAHEPRALECCQPECAAFRCSCRSPPLQDKYTICTRKPRSRAAAIR